MISRTQRHLNIISKSISLGFDFDYDISFEELYVKAEDFLIDNAIEADTYEKVICETCGNTMHWTDRMGFEIETWGEYNNTWAVDSYGEDFQLIPNNYKVN